MRVIARNTLLAFVANLVDGKDRKTVSDQLDNWYRVALAAKWNNSAELRLEIGSASIVSAERVVFNIKGNDYRMVAVVTYAKHAVVVLWLGTHKEYDKIDVRKVQYDRTRYFGSSDRDAR